MPIVTKATESKGNKKSGEETGEETEIEEDVGASSAGIDQITSDDITEGNDRLMIRGPAGDRKSTLLPRWCAIQAAHQVLAGPPILARASRVARDPEDPSGVESIQRRKSLQHPKFLAN